MRSLLLCLGCGLLLTVSATAGYAQAPVAPLHPVALSPLLQIRAASSPLAERDTVPDLSPRPDSYQREGGFVGALVFGLLGVFLASKICSGDEDQREEHCGTETAGVGVAGVLGGFALGSLIGKQFAKHPAEDHR